MQNLFFQFSVADFQFVKPGLTKHVCWCEWGIILSNLFLLP